MRKKLKKGLALILFFLLCCSPLQALNGGGSTVHAAEPSETLTFAALQDAFVSNFNNQGNNVGISLNTNKLIIGKFRHAYLKFDLSTIDTERYDVNDMSMVLTFRKSHAPNEIVITESELNLQGSEEKWSINNLTYNNRPNEIADSNVVSYVVASTGESNLSIDVSEIFQDALLNGRSEVSLHVTTASVDNNDVAASEMFSSRNTSGHAGPALTVTLGEPVVDDNVTREELIEAIEQAEQLQEPQYTPESWSKLKAALHQAITIKVSNATQEQVDQATLQLLEAINDLVQLEQPSKVTGPDMGNYYSNSNTAAKIFKMKNEQGQYVQVDPSTEKLGLTEDADEATSFALYVLDYFSSVDYSYEGSEIGATRTAYSIKALNNNKFLSIQNYYTAEQFLSNTHHYFNIISGAMSGTSTQRVFEIKASADIANWNERFYIDHYEDSGYYRLWSHLSTMRDDVNFDKFNVVMSTDGMTSSGIEEQNVEYKFHFEELEDQHLLEISQKVSNDNAELYWLPVNGDTDADHYVVEDTEAEVGYSDGFMRATLSELAVGEHEFAVAYNGDDVQHKATVTVRIFNHPGILQTEDDLDRMKERVLSKAEPWYSDYQRLLHTVPYGISDADFETTVFATVGRGGSPSDSANIGHFEKGGNAAYFNALQWVITGDEQHAEAAANIVRQWSETLKVIDGRDRILGAGINAYKYASTAEILRYYDGGYSDFTDSDLAALQNMLLNVVYPVIQDAAAPMLANGNWDVAAILSMMAIGVITDQAEIFDRAAYLYQDIHVNGSIFAYIHESGQTMETGRDQAHALLALGYMAEICIIANNQGVDLYSLYDNRLAKAFEYSSKFNLFAEELYGESVPFVAMPNVFADTSRGYYGAGFDRDNNGLNRGELRPVFEQGLALYSDVDGIDLVWTERAAAAARPQAMVHFDNINFGTLIHYKGEPVELNGPYFQLRTRWEPLYQRNWSIVENERVAETLNSYYELAQSGELVTSVMKKDAPFYQLINNEDGTYSIRAVTSNTYLSVKEEQAGEYNLIKADAEEIGDNEKFLLQSTGVGPYFLVSPAFDHRIVYQEVSGSGVNAKLTLRLGTKTLAEIKDTPDVTTNERLIFMYNIEDVARGIQGAPVITSGDHLTVNHGEANTFQVEATGTSPIDFYLKDAPQGITINNRTGLMSIDDKLEEGEYQFTIIAYNGLQPNGQQLFTLVVIDNSGGSDDDDDDQEPSPSPSTKPTPGGSTPDGSTPGGSTPDGESTPTPTVEPSPTTTPKPTVIPTTDKPVFNEKVKVDAIKSKLERAQAAPSVNFNDVDDSLWSASEIDKASKMGIVSGYIDGTFRPNEQVTRAEFATMLVKAFGLSANGSETFTDVERHWAAYSIAVLKDLDLLNGYSDGTFRPNQAITRAEIVAILARLTDYVPNQTAAFSDIENSWAKDEIAAFTAAGIVNGKDEKQFAPNDSASRAEAIVIIIRLIEKMIE